MLKGTRKRREKSVAVPVAQLTYFTTFQLLSEVGNSLEWKRLLSELGVKQAARSVERFTKSAFTLWERDEASARLQQRRHRRRRRALRSTVSGWKKFFLLLNNSLPPLVTGRVAPPPPHTTWPRATCVAVGRLRSCSHSKRQCTT